MSSAEKGGTLGEPLFTRLRLPYGKEVKDLSVVRRQHLLPVAWILNVSAGGAFNAPAS